MTSTYFKHCGWCHPSMSCHGLLSRRGGMRSDALEPAAAWVPWFNVQASTDCHTHHDEYRGLCMVEYASSKKTRSACKCFERHFTHAVLSACDNAYLTPLGGTVQQASAALDSAGIFASTLFHFCSILGNCRLGSKALCSTVPNCFARNEMKHSALGCSHVCENEICGISSIGTGQHLVIYHGGLVKAGAVAQGAL